MRLELIDPAIAKCRGRIIKTTGDGMLVEFQSVTDAVQLRGRIPAPHGAPQRGRAAGAQRSCFRIGINLGDVIVEDDDIFGDGVNVAARLEAMAEPGGICVSAAVRDQVGDRLDVGVRGSRRAERQEHQPAHPRLPRSSRRSSRRLPAERSAAEGRAARVPSIAVLPFANMSGDPEQEFFADGLTEDIITELSRFRDLLVISRNAVFVHKGKPVTARGIAKEFGVDYVVEGSVRKAADRVRVTVQLIDGETETHVWAERYDRKLEDIFAIQDEVTVGHRGDAARPGRGGDARARQAQADREHGGLRIRAHRKGPAPLVGARIERRGAPHAGQGDRARSEIRACACLEGLRARPGLGAQLVRRRRSEP